MSRQATVYFSYLGWDYPVEVIDLSVMLDSMPSDSADSSGSTGEVTFSIGKPNDPEHPLNSEGFAWAKDKEFRLHFGMATMEGRVVSGGDSDNATRMSFTGSTSAFRLQAYNVVIPPFRGTLKAALEQYFRHIGITDWNVVSTFSVLLNRQVIFPGWTGEFWPNIKLLCAAEQIDLSFTSFNRVEIYPLRFVEAEHDRTVSKTISSTGGSLAQFVEVYDYSSKWVTDELVYPHGGWSEDVPVLSVPENEYIEHTLELNTSLTAFKIPTMQTFVGQMHSSSSVYTIVADDGFPIKPAQWADYGGHIEFEVGKEFNTIVVKMRGPRGILNPETGDPFTNFRMALASDTSGSEYSTLRIVGTGVQYKRDMIRIPTGVSASETGTEVGATIDNPFIATREGAYSAGIKAATKFQGFSPTLSVTSQGLFDGDAILVIEPQTYFSESTRYFRTRNVSYTPNEMNITAEETLTFGDLDFMKNGTFGSIKAANPGATFGDLRVKGLQIGI